MTAQAGLLAVTDLTVQYRGTRRNAPVRAVNGVSFTVSRGETLGLIGESGSGKSTIARAVLGLVAPSSGSITFDGAGIWQLPAREQREYRRRLQIVFQSPFEALDPMMRIAASVREPLGGDDRSGVAAGDAVRAALERVGLDASFGGRRPHELSGGQRQRVNIARALVTSPELVVCDEVVSALDVSVQAEILNLLASLQAESGLSYLFISHDIGVVSNIARRVAVLYLGRLAELGSTSQVVDHPAHPYTRALIAAAPLPVPRRLRGSERPVLHGSIPSPADPPSGCYFRTRCPLAQPRCAAEIPAFRELAPGHWASCHFAEPGAARGASAPSGGHGRPGNDERQATYRQGDTR
jgi:peptide/nickel transport system ATP-binding protein/oligopeptide transport system ATP-binding protein